MHGWTFFRAGGVDQVSLETGADILALGELDQKLWVALEMPTRGVDIDPATLDMLDTDKDGRVRVPEILAAVEWIRTAFVRPDDLLHGKPEVALAAIADHKIRAAAQRMLSDLGKTDATSVSVDDSQKVTKAFVDTRLNGDGVVIPESADAPEVRALIEQISKTHGTLPDLSGKPGIDQKITDLFFADVDAEAAWLGKSHGDPAILPLGPATAGAADAYGKVRAKIEDWQARCQLAAFDPRAGAVLSGKLDDLEALATRELSPTGADIAKLPLARVEPSARLPIGATLGAAINPAWRAHIGDLATKAVTPLLGARDMLSADDLHQLAGKLAPFEAWRGSRPTTKLAALTPEQIEALAAPPLRSALAAVIAADKALEHEYAAISSVDKLVRLQRDFIRVLRNFANFADFYGRRDAAFQVGTLYLDGRACRLCVSVSDAGKHASLAPASDACLVYCDIRRTGEHKQIVAALTNGDEDNVFVGRNGVFYDRQGLDWDATIAKIVSNPISVRAAFWAPYKKVVRLIEEQVAKRASAAEAEADSHLTGTATNVASADQMGIAHATAAAPPAPPAKKIDVGTVAAIGVAVGGIGAMVAGILGAFFGLGYWMPIGVVALILGISGPSMLLAWLKLRRRNMGPLLDANGWAVNGRARVNVSFGAALTELATLPPGSSRSLDDPYADKPTPWKRWIVLGVLILLVAVWGLKVFDPYLPAKARFGNVVRLLKR